MMYANGECVEFGPKLSSTGRQLGFIVNSTGNTLTVRILVLTREENRMSWVPPLLRLTPPEVTVDLTTNNVKLVLVLSKSIWEQKKLYYVRNASGCYAIEEDGGMDFGTQMFHKTSGTNEFASLLQTHRALEIYRNRLDLISISHTSPPQSPSPMLAVDTLPTNRTCA